MNNCRIHVLSDEVVGKISAGEVVEHPASVVKELVENSIDAGANSIEIEMQQAGQTLIRVADNGKGMTSEEVKISCRQHATSKIRCIDDLNHIRTLGFRGEALSSIASVSQMDLISRTQYESSGVYIYLEGGEMLTARPVGRSQGTTVEVRNLFYNVPARRKFLKKESTELAGIVNVIGRFIVSYPNIEFKLTQSGKSLLHATKDMGIINRIRLVLGGDVSDCMLDISARDSDKCKVEGYVSRPSSTRKDRRAQMFFVNGRFIRNKTLSDAVYNAYRSLLERGRHPATVLFLTVSPQEVDVNVHPTKLEIKFSDERTIKDAVTGSIMARFNKIKTIESETSSLASSSSLASANQAKMAVFPDVSETQTEFTYDSQKKSDWIKSSEKNLTENIFQIYSCYIVQAGNEGITITDQHAAHERILYEFFSKTREKGPIEVQNLLFPVRIDLSADETIIMEKVIESFKVLGFLIEPFGEKSFAIQSLPAILTQPACRAGAECDIKTVIADILSDLMSYNLATISVTDELVKLTSCRAAIKAQDVLNKEEMGSLMDQLRKCSLPFTCPHGRPTTLKITQEELEKRFRRI